jgi:hypothetical protein
MSFWESQPAAYTLDRQPCFVYTLRWANYQIRSLHTRAESRRERSSLCATDATNS